MIIINKIILIIGSFGGGIIVGGAIAAFITILEIVPRLAQFTETENKIKLYQSTMVTSFILSIIFYFYDFKLNVFEIVTIPVGFIYGVFIGLLSSALAEVLNVIPVIAKKVKIKNDFKYLVWALAGGKVAGSLIYWIILN